MPPSSALLIGGTGPTGPHLKRGLQQRGFDVTLMHTGRHELDEVADVPHLHCDVRSADAIATALGAATFDVAVVTYGRLREIARVLRGRVGKFISIGGVPAYRGYFDGALFTPPGLPVPTREDATTSSEAEDGKSYRIRRTEEIVFELHPSATHFRYPFVHGPRQLAPREWCVVRRILDERPFIVIPDDGLTLVTFGFTENLAHAVLLPLDHPEPALGQIFNAGDDECLTIRQIVELLTDEFEHQWDIVNMPADLALPARPLMMASRTTHRVTGTDKLRELLGYRDVVGARDAVRTTGRWLAEHRPVAGGLEERVLQDPFDYPAEDALVASWRAAKTRVEVPEWTTAPGYGLSYAGPGTSYRRADTRI